MNTESNEGADAAQGIERLRWRERPEDFEVLCSHVLGKLRHELSQLGVNLEQEVPSEELSREIRRAAETCTDSLRRTVGLELHILLWLRTYIGERLSRNQPFDPTRPV